MTVPEEVSMSRGEGAGEEQPLADGLRREGGYIVGSVMAFAAAMGDSSEPESEQQQASADAAYEEGVAQLRPAGEEFYEVLDQRRLMEGRKGGNDQK